MKPKNTPTGPETPDIPSHAAKELREETAESVASTISPPLAPDAKQLAEHIGNTPQHHVVVGAGGGVGKKLAEVLQGQAAPVIPIGTRDPHNEEIFKAMNTDHMYALGDTFDPNDTPAEVLHDPSTAEQKEGFIYFLAATNMDPLALISEGKVVDTEGNEITKRENPEKWELYSDYYDPRTWKEWSDELKHLLPGEDETQSAEREGKNAVRKDHRREIRFEEAEKQIALWEGYLENILENRSQENPGTLNIFYSGSIACMFDFKHSAYGLLKTQCAELAEEYRLKFALKFGYGKVNIIDLSLAFIDTAMGNARPHLVTSSAVNAARGGRLMPIRGKYIYQSGALDPKSVAAFIGQISQPEILASISHRQLVQDESDLDIETLQRRYEEDIEHIQESLGDADLDRSSEGDIVLDDRARTFLEGLRATKLKQYVENYQAPAGLDGIMQKSYKKPDETSVLTKGQNKIEGRWNDIRRWIQDHQGSETISEGSETISEGSETISEGSEAISISEEIFIKNIALWYLNNHV